MSSVIAQGPSDREDAFSDPGGEDEASVRQARTSRRPSQIRLLLWLALVLATIADVLTYTREAAATVMEHELSPMAHWLGPGLGAALVTKSVGGLLLLTAFWCFRRAHSSRWLEPAIIAFFTLASFFAAWTNVVFT